MTLDIRAKSRDLSLIRGIATGLVGRGIGLLAPFLVMPAMLNHLGSENFGIWMTLVSITSMAMFMDFGIGNGLLTKLSKAFGNEDHFAMRQLIASGYVTLTLIALTAGILLVAGLGLLGSLKPESVALLNNVSAKQIVFVTSLAFLVGIPVSVIQRVMLACQKTTQANAWQVVGSFLSVPLTYGAIYLNLSAFFVVAAYSISPILVMLISTVSFFGKYEELRPKRLNLSGAHAKELITLGSYFFILSIITSIALNADNMIIALTLGPEAVTEYVVPAKLGSILGLLVTTLFLPLWAANGEALVRKDYFWMQQTAHRMSTTGGLLVGSLGLMLTFFSTRVIDLWMGRQFTDSMEIVAGFALIYTLMAIASPFHMILNSGGLLKVQIQSWLLFGAVSIATKYLIISTYGKIWITPFISACCFLIIVLPVNIAAARRTYRNF